jgi:plastocyanin
VKVTKLGVLAVAASIAALVATATAYDVKPGKGGKIKGKALFKADKSKANKPLKVEKDPDMCGESTPDPDLIVGEGDGLADVVVWIKKIDAGKDWPASMKKCEIDNTHCSFAPHVAFVMKGGEVTFKNSDSKLHNIKAVSADYNFNDGVDAGKTMTKKCDRGNNEEVKLSCSIHPWMSGQLIVVTHPYYVATNAKGEYELDDVPAGKYTLMVKHAKLGRPAGADKGVEIEVKEGADATKDFEFTKAD